MTTTMKSNNQFLATKQTKSFKIWRTDKVARSGNRPRFKRSPARPIQFVKQKRQQYTCFPITTQPLAGQQRRKQLIKLELVVVSLAVAISILQLNNISVISCDENNNNKLIGQAADRLSWLNDDHLSSSQLSSSFSQLLDDERRRIVIHETREKSNIVDNDSASEALQQQQHSGNNNNRFKRNNHHQHHQSTGADPNWENKAPDLDTLKVASFASKLEHWLQCSRLGLASQQQQQTATHHVDANNNGNQPPPPPTTTTTTTSSQTNGACSAHFDGHLCWPPSKIGERVRLPCPKLNWWPRNNNRKQQDEQQSTPPISRQSVKHVIDSIQQQQQQINNAPPPPPIDLVAATSSQLSSIKLQQTTTTTEAPPVTSQRTMAPLLLQPEEQQQTGQPLMFAWRTCEHQQTLGGDYEPLDSAGRRSIDSSNNSDPPSWNETAATPGANLTGRWQDGADYSQCPQTKTGQFDPTDQWIKLEENFDRQLFHNLARALERIEANIDLYSDPDIQDQWNFCIGETMRQLKQEQQSALSLENNETGQFCPVIFDGWRCWPKTRAGEIAYVTCPRNQPGFSAERKAHKICTNQADWYRHPLTNRYWSNYTTCVDTVDLAFRTKILNLYIIGNLISLIALTASLIIFISFKSLNCTRVTIHKNLFLSFITNNLMWIIWYTYVVNDADLLQSNPIECQFWHILLHYFLVSNYFWMFCEGLYLHTLLVVAFVSEDKILKWFYLLGWLTPVPITIAYAYNRSYDEYYTNFCWMEESPHNIILMAPIGISLLLNLIFLINIVRVLVTKLRANNSPDTHQTRKAVRATLILIPLLGLHYMLTPFRPEAKSEWEVIYEIVAAVCTSFQGLCVALLFCFCNGEVISVIKKKLKDTCKSREPMRGRSGTKMGSTSIGLAFGSSSSSSTAATKFNGNKSNHHHHNQHQLEASHTLRSIVSTSSQSDLVQAINTKVGVAAAQQRDLQNNNTNGSSNNNNQLASNNMNGLASDDHSPRRGSHSNTNSVLTTITASPISINNHHHHSYHQLQSNAADPTTTTNTATTTATSEAAPYCETILQDKSGVQTTMEEAVRLL